MVPATQALADAVTFPSSLKADSDHAAGDGLCWWRRAIWTQTFALTLSYERQDGLQGSQSAKNSYTGIVFP